jgi:hypothetical protein
MKSIIAIRSIDATAVVTSMRGKPTLKNALKDIG